jgi:hypothetical protein
MKSPLVRVILATLGGYLLILFGLLAYDWYQAEFPSPSDEPVVSARIQHPIAHREALAALERVSGLSAKAKAALIKRIEADLISVDRWLNGLGGTDIEILCIGEYHNEATRRFLADEILSKAAADTLMLEATPDELDDLVKRMEAGRDYFPLLDADVLSVLRKAKARNPDIRIVGIEETQLQEAVKTARAGSRDRSIARNFWDGYRPGKRHIILFGALHCQNEPNWLYSNLRRQATPLLRQRMINVQVVGEHQNGAVEAFVYVLDELGVRKNSFAIADTHALPPLIRTLFPSLNRQVLEKVRTLIVFRNAIEARGNRR